VEDHGWPSVIQPALLIHPESGRKCICLSQTYVDYFLGMEPKESQDLLEYLVDHMLQDKYVYQHKWAPDDAIVWDNRRFMHSSGGNFPGDTRYGLRTTLAGPTRTGRYLDEDTKAGETLLAD
jgi:taurine dioxygenase